eukprot:TRINITY_DN63315_c0_g1_i1.p1 TRINITY_DN63315_c0_g1~~TRINITY_DN63315_c0_g1_i1.p1  ORF type:complete len:218 (-),score=40.64 TRINITY_DN63315_c0_g1_i1:287-940(-)
MQQSASACALKSRSASAAWLPKIRPLSPPLNAAGWSHDAHEIHAYSMPSSPLSKMPSASLRSLDGLAARTQVHNWRAQRSFAALMQDTARTPSASLRQGGLPSELPLSAGDEEPDFTGTVEQLSATISELRNRHQSWDAEKVGRTSPSASAMKRNQHELRKKLEAYKMVRKLEPEMPPFERLTPLRQPERPSRNLIKRNASSQALQRISRVKDKVVA